MQNKKFNQVRLLTRQFSTDEENAAFDLQSRCVCDLFSRFARARGAELRGAHTLVGEFADGPDAARVEMDAEGTAVVSRTDDVTGVLSLSDMERKRAFLHLILRTLDIHFNGRTPQPLLDAAADVRAADFVNAWTWAPGAKRSPGQDDWRTIVTVLHDLREYEIRLEVVDGRALPAFEQVLVRGKQPDASRIIAEDLGELAWDEPRRIVLRPRQPVRPPVVVDLPSSFARL